MQTIKHISVPQPCHQNWNEMTAVDKGHHCAHCCKTVTDFTVMSNQQIIDALSNKKDVCGRFEDWQLASVNRQLKAQHSLFTGWKKLRLVVSVFFAIVSFKGYGQSTNKIKRQVHQTPPEKKLVLTDSLTASYADFKFIDSKTNGPEIKPFVIDLPAQNISYTLGGAIGGIVIEEKPRVFNSFYSIYDLLINLR